MQTYMLQKVFFYELWEFFQKGYFVVKQLTWGWLILSLLLTRTSARKALGYCTEYVQK